MTNATEKKEYKVPDFQPFGFIIEILDNEQKPVVGVKFSVDIDGNSKSIETDEYGMLKVHRPKNNIKLTLTNTEVSKSITNNYPKNPEPLPAFKLCNKYNEPNPILGMGALGNQYKCRMFYEGKNKGELVKTLQKMLIALKCDIGKTDIDGKFGDSTENAVKEFQEKNKDWEGKQLKVEGLIGPLTADALNRAMVGIWYPEYKTPYELTKDKNIFHITATKEALRNSVSFDPEDAKTVEIALVDIKTKWSIDWACIGDTVGMLARSVDFPDGTSANFIVYKCNSQGNRELVQDGIRAEVHEGQAEAEWQFQCGRDSENIMEFKDFEAEHTFPEFIFDVEIEDKIFSCNNLLRYYGGPLFISEKGVPIEDMEAIAFLSDGQIIPCKIQKGYLTEPYLWQKGKVKIHLVSNNIGGIE
jgi:hypothetical protein